jgi:hypothetical protein
MTAMPHPEFQPPPKHAKIWRYMDLAKFVWMLEKQSLYLSSINRLTRFWVIPDRFDLHA